MSEQAVRRRRRWRCRRGLLELDLVMLGFFDARYDGLSVPEQDLFGDLLEQADDDLDAWILRGETVNQERFGKLVEAIRRYHPAGD